MHKQEQDLQIAGTMEKELWVSKIMVTGQPLHLIPSNLPQTELLRLSRTNFSEAFQLLVHLKVIRLFVESVLRYGLPATYTGIAVKVIFLLARSCHQN